MSTAKPTTAPAPVRVLHLYRRFAPDFTGDGLYYQRLIPHMRALGTEHAVLATETRGGAAQQTLDGLPVQYLADSPLSGKSWALHRWLLANARTFDLLHLHTHVDWRLSAYVLARALGKPVVFSCSLDDSPSELLRHYNPVARPIARLLLRAVNVFVAISPRLYRLSLQAVAPERVSYIPQGIEDAAGPGPWPSVRSELRRTMGVADSDVLLLSVGSVCERKNTLFLIDLLASIREPHVKLALVGPVLEPAYAAEVQRRIAQYGLRGRIIELGFQPKPDQYYKASDIFVFASNSEGFGNVYLEAMVHSLPVVTRPLPGITDHLFSYGENGYFSNDLASFRNHVQSLIENPELRSEIGLAAREFALSQYRLEHMAQSYVELFFRLKKRSASAPNLRRSDVNPESKLSAPAVFSACADLTEGPALVGLRRVDLPRAMQPVLLIVVDTEAEFDWAKGTRDDTGRVTAAPYLVPFIERLLAMDAPPCLVVDHPVATGASSAPLLRQFAAEGVELGVHLQPWTTPPFGEPLDSWHSYCGNLPPAFERVKLQGLRTAIQGLTKQPVRVFKAGRYGAGPNTFRQLPELGLDIDLSVCPGYDMRADGGPDWSQFGSEPAWIGPGKRLLSLPTTAGYAGPLAALLNRSVVAKPMVTVLKKLRLGRIHRLSPEGNDLAAMQALTHSLLAAGQRVLTLSLHSPSLGPGFTPYAMTPLTSAALVENTISMVKYFQESCGGRVVTPSQFRNEL